MKKITMPPANKLRCLFACMLTIFLFYMQIPVAAAYNDWDITSFKTDITISKDSSITVTENIVADFSREEHHGIYRYIPVKYRDDFGNNLNLQFNLKSITDETGKAWTYDQSYEGDSVYLTIGDADIYLNKPSTFIITYEADKAINFFKDHDELYWNATGTDWGVPMKQVTSSVTLPAGANDKDIQVACYTGVYGSSSQNCKSSASGGKATFNVDPNADGNALNTHEGLTIVVGWPKGLVTPPSILQQVMWFLQANWGFGLPLLTFAGLFYLWYTRGRDPKTSRTAIMPIYEPPDKLTPTEVGTIIDESADTRDITSAIIDLAVRGYLKITEIKEKVLFFNSTDYEFTLLKDFKDDKDLKEHEKKILDSVFGAIKTKRLSDLQNKFYRDIPDIKTQIYSQLVQDGYFPTNPEKIRNVYYSIGGVLVGITVFLGGLLVVFFSLSVVVGIALSGIIFLIFAGRMPAKTMKGVETYYKIKGLEEYIGTAEKDRIKWQEKENIFEKLLPYAMTLGLVSKWTSAFADLYKNPPSWYGSSDPNFAAHFTTYALLNSLNSMNTSMQTTFTSSPRSSASSGGSGFGGGGFSGGGFGGGGGGAW